MVLATRIVSRVVFLIVLVGCAGEESAGHRYGTWDNMEIDKCASAWLIKRHVDPNAEFVFFPVGKLITAATPFDTPDAEWRRTPETCTFEAIVKANQLTDSTLAQMSRIVHELELTSWEAPRSRISAWALRVDSLVREIIRTSTDPEECLRRSFVAFDSIYLEGPR